MRRACGREGCEEWLSGRKGTVEANGRKCPKCGAMIEYLCYWEKAVNSGEYWPDGFHDIRVDYVIEFYFMCPECGKILFSHKEAARKFLRGQPIKEEEICPEDY
jgi:predicted RNA-binding Zn-ribbon protein involved in translation (DUF1610 family)